MASQNDITVVALVVAVVALFVALSQLTQQMFGTADGLRRCQKSVIGPWSKKARLRWRFSEFRFETRYMVPHFTFEVLNESTFAQSLHDYREKETLRHSEANNLPPRRPNTMLILGDDKSRERTMTPQKSNKNYFFDEPDLVDWLAFLDQLHNWTKLALRPLADLRDQPLTRLNWQDIHEQPFPTVPAIIPRSHSWDLVPPDVVRPLATSTIGEIIVLAHRLRMTFTELRPSEGILRARGGARSLTSSNIKFIGLVVSFTYTDPKNENQDPVLIPSAEADKFACGILPGCRVLGVQDYPLVAYKWSNKPIRDLLEGIGVSAGATDFLTKGKAFDDFSTRETYLPGFADVVPMLAPYMRLHGSRIIKFKWPIPLYREMASPCMWREGRIILHHRLKQIVAEAPRHRESAQLRWVLEQLDLFKKDVDHWYTLPHSQGNNLRNNWDWAKFQKLEEIHEQTTAYFRTLYMSDLAKEKGDPERRLSWYSRLVAAHISMVALAVRDKKKSPHLREQPDDAPTNLKMWMVERCNLYVDLVEDDDYVGRFASDLHMDTMAFRDAWWMLMLRSFVWSRSVAPVCADANDKMLPEYYDNKMLVYLT